MATLTTSERIIDALDSENGRTVNEIAAATGLGRSTVGKALVELERERRVGRVGGAHVGGRRSADRWLIARVRGSRRPKSTRTPPAQEPKTRKDNARLGRGELRGRVLDALRLAAEPVGPSALARSLGHSSGAVSNALERLVANNVAECVGDTPKRYREEGLGQDVTIDGRNRALRKLLGWLSESDLDVLVWKTEDDTPTIVSVVDRSIEPVHAATLQVLDTTEDADQEEIR